MTADDITAEGLAAIRASRDPWVRQMIEDYIDGMNEVTADEFAGIIAPLFGVSPSPALEAGLREARYGEAGVEDIMGTLHAAEDAMHARLAAHRERVALEAEDQRVDATREWHMEHGL